ncbi:hypothetical protein EV586_101748 [Tumebacillus sp. BK434]|uniref:hypothetical protein n=1 Tax=Tumebacillus sp. BK434 TaxID=2512169 RepID=UPI0010D57D8B|nr:hypothetical protein [Tumebacillus sp. BK434]TCP59528.1 hypothetical protein EV586_101748 [Tumebacillus sp. BK434]
MSTIDSNNKLKLDEVTPPFPVPETGNAGGGISTDEITPPFPGSPKQDGEPDNVK